MRNCTSRRLLAILPLLLGTTFAVYAADWPQFQGPDRNGISPETGLLRSWPDDGPKVLWSIELGPGYGAASIRDNEIYVLDRPDTEKDILRCLDLATGKELWNYEYAAPGSVSHDGSRTPPTVDAECVYCVGMAGQFTCVDRKTHQPVWSHNIVTDFGVEIPRWGVSQSPALYKDLVIVAPQAPDAFVAAYNRKTGELAWKSSGLGLAGYVPPVVTTLAGVDQVVAIGASSKDGTTRGQVAGLSLDDGHVLWSYDGWQCFIPIPYPTPLPGDRLFITGGYKAGSAMIQVSKEGDVFQAKELFKTDKCGSQIHQPIFYLDHLYINSNSNEREDGMMCMALDGTITWQTGDAWFGTTFERGNLMMADGLIYNLDGKKGVLYLIEPSPKEFKSISSVKILDGKEIWAPMALSNGKLVVRSQHEMKCLDVKGK